MEAEPWIASCAFRIPSSNVASWLISVAMISVGLISSPLISEKCVVRLLNAFRVSSAAFFTTPTVTMA